MTGVEAQMATPGKSAAKDDAPKSRGDRRRALILKAFHDCIIEHGYAKTTLRDVAKAAGISASHLLYYFPGKDSILEHYFEEVASRIVRRIESFRGEEALTQVELLSDLFFAGKGITRSEIGFMLECFGVAVHDKQLHKEKERLDRYCKDYLAGLFARLPSGNDRATANAEIAYSLLIGLRTAAYFDRRMDLPTARRLFNEEMISLAGVGERR